MGKNLIVWLVIAAVLLTVFNNFNVKEPPQQLTYSEFLAQVRNDRVADVLIDNSVIYGNTKTGEEFQVVRPPGVNDGKLIDDLYNHRVEIIGKRPEQQSILSLIHI